jgi:excisionase family DNA binding protein
VSVRIEPRPTPERIAYRPSEVAAMLGVGRSTVFEWCRLRRVETVRIDGVVLIPRSALDELLATHRVPARSLGQDASPRRSR